MRSLLGFFGSITGSRPCKVQVFKAADSADCTFVVARERSNPTTFNLNLLSAHSATNSSFDKTEKPIQSSVNASEQILDKTQNA